MADLWATLWSNFRREKEERDARWQQQRARASQQSDTAGNSASVADAATVTQENSGSSWLKNYLTSAVSGYRSDQIDPATGKPYTHAVESRRAKYQAARDKATEGGDQWLFDTLLAASDKKLQNGGTTDFDSSYMQRHEATRAQAQSMLEHYDALTDDQKAWLADSAWGKFYVNAANSQYQAQKARELASRSQELTQEEQMALQNSAWYNFWKQNEERQNERLGEDGWSPLLDQRARQSQNVRLMQGDVAELDRRREELQAESDALKGKNDDFSQQRKRNIDEQLRQLNSVRDLLYATEKTKDLPKEVITLLDLYNNADEVQEKSTWASLLLGVSQDSAEGYAQEAGEQMRSKSDYANDLLELGIDNYEELAELRKYVTDKTRYDEMNAMIEDFTKEHPIIGAALARGANAIGAATGTMQMISDALSGSKADIGLNPYASGYLLRSGAQTADQTLADSFSDGVLSKGTKAFLYNTAASGVDSLAASLLPGGMGEVMLGAGAMVDTMLDAKKSGSTDTQAFTTGLFAGIMEGLFEHVSIGNLKGMKEVPVESVKDIAMNLLKAAGANASEEALTEIANVVGEWWLNRGGSRLVQSIQAGVAEGLTVEEAKKRAFKDAGMDVLEAGASGALMGVGFSAVGSTRGALYYNSQAHATGQQVAQNGGVGELLESAGTFEGADQNRVAQVETALQNATAGEETMQKITEALSEKGVEGEALQRQSALLFEALTDQTGLTKAQRSQIESSEVLRSTLAELAGSLDAESRGSGYSAKDLRNIGKLELAVEKGIAGENRATLEGAARARLVQLGESEKSAGKIAKKITEAATEGGGKLTKRQKHALNESKYGRTVWAELTDKDRWYRAPWFDEASSAMERGGLRHRSPKAYEALKANTKESITGETGKYTNAANGLEQLLFDRVPTADRAAFDKSFETFYEFGKRGYNYSQVQDTTAAEAQFTDEMKKEAFDAGVQAAKAGQAQNVQRGAPAQVVANEAGTLQSAAKDQIEAMLDDSPAEEAPPAVFEFEDGTVGAAPAAKAKTAAEVADAAKSAAQQTEAEVTRAANAYRDEETARIFVSGYRQGVAVKSYDRAFSTFYAAGINANGASFEQIRDGSAKGMLRFIDEETAQKAFEAGKEAAKGTTSSGAARSPSPKGGGLRSSATGATPSTAKDGKAPSGGNAASSPKGGALRGGGSAAYYNRSAKSEMDAVYHALAARTGLVIERNESVWAKIGSGKTVTQQEANGQFLAESFKVVMSANANSEFTDLVHELGHGVAAYDAKGYRGLLAAIRDWYMETEGIASFEDAIEGILSQYEGTDENFTRADAEEEFFSEAMAGLFSTEDGAKQFLDWLSDEKKVESEEKKSIIKKMADLLQDLFDHIMALIRGGTLSKTAADFARMEADRAQMLRQDFLAALDVMKENAQKGTKEGSGKFSLQYLEHFSQKEYNDWGWVIVNDLLTKTEYTHLMDQFAREENLDDKYRMTPEGEKLILVGNTPANYDHLVFIKGTYDHPIITRVVDVWSNFDRLVRGHYLEEARIYAEKKGAAGLATVEDYAGEELFARYTREDYRSYRELRRAGNSKRNQESNRDRGAQQDGRGSAGEDSEAASDRENHERVKHSLGITAASEAEKSLAQRNTELEQIARDLENQVRDLRRQLGAGGVQHVVDVRKVKQAAQKLRAAYGSNIKIDTLTERLNDFFNQLANEKALSWDVVQAGADDIAEQILKESGNLRDVPQENLDVIRDIRSVGVVLNEGQKAAAREKFGSYGAFTRRAAGSLRIRREGTADAVPLDQRYSELAAQYPSLLPADAADADQAVLLYEAVQALRNPYFDKESGQDLESARDFLVQDIYQAFLDVPETMTLENRKKAEVLKAKVDFQQRLDSAKAQYTKQYKQAQQDFRQALRDSTQAVREDYLKRRGEDRLEAQAHYRMRLDTARDTMARQAGRDQIQKRKKRMERMMAPTRGLDNVPQALRPLAQALLDGMPEKGKPFTGDDWTRIKETYEAAFQENDDFAGLMVDVKQNMISTITALRESIKEKQMIHLSLDELNNIKKVYDHVFTLIKNEQETLVDGRRQKVAELGAQTMQEFEKIRNDKKHRTGVAALEVNSKKPVYFFKRIGGVMQTLWWDLEKGQNKYAMNVSRGKDYWTKVFERYNAREWAKEEPKEFTLKRGRNGKPTQIKLTVGQRLSLYATARREFSSKKETQHLLSGGICFENQWVKEKVKGKDGKSKTVYRMEGSTYALTAEDVLAITDSLTKAQKDYADELVHYLSTEMAALGNEVTMELYGYNMFTEERYFPYNTKQSYLFQKFGEQGESMLQSMGFTNATKHHASTPLVLSEFDDIVLGHIERMSAYNAMVLPINSMSKLWNYRTDFSEDAEMKTLAQTFTSTFGQNYTNYFKQFMKDVNGQQVGDSRESTAANLIREFKKNAVFASASVVLQQPGAVGRALAYIGPQYFVKTTVSRRLKAYEEAKQYSGIAILKEIGGFDTGSGRTTVEWMKEAATKPKGVMERAKGMVSRDSSYRDSVLSAPAGKADEITWGHIWLAAKAKAKKQTSLTGEALNRKAAEIFNECIEYTQVYDSVMSRSALMRSNSAMLQSLTAFMGEPTTTFNMIEDALLSKSPKYAVKVFSAVITATLLTSALKSLVTAGRDRDEDESLLEKYLAQLVSNFIYDLNPMTMVPLMRDIASMIQGYSVSRSDTEVFSSIINAFQNMFNDNLRTDEKLTSILGALGPFIGVPIRNITRDAYTLQRIIGTIKRGYKFSSGGFDLAMNRESLQFLRGLGFDKKFEVLKEKSDNEVMLEALLAGDDEMYRRMASKKDSGEKVRNALISVVRDKLESGEYDAPKAIEVLTDKVGVSKMEAEKKVRDWLEGGSDDDEGSEDEYADYFTAEGVRNHTDEGDVNVDWQFVEKAVKSGDTATIQAEIENVKRIYGKTDKEIATQVKKYVKEYEPMVEEAAAAYERGDIGSMEASAAVIAKKYDLDVWDAMSMIRTSATYVDEEGNVKNYSSSSSSAIPGTNYIRKDLVVAIESGDNAAVQRIRSEIAAGLASKSDAETDKKKLDEAYSDIRKTLTDYYKPRYLAGDEATRLDIYNKLKNSYCYNKEHSLDKIIEGWLEDK